MSTAGDFGGSPFLRISFKVPGEGEHNPKSFNPVLHGHTVLRVSVGSNTLERAIPFAAHDLQFMLKFTHIVCDLDGVFSIED